MASFDPDIMSEWLCALEETLRREVTTTIVSTVRQRNQYMCTGNDYVGGHLVFYLVFRAFSLGIFPEAYGRYR